MLSTIEYSYEKVGSWWYIYKNIWNHDRTRSSGSKLTGEPLDKEEARKETYRLNGWEYKEPNTNNNNTKK